jgi:peptide/nickel transport system permease protein
MSTLAARTPRIRVPFRGDVLSRIALLLLTLLVLVAMFGPLLPLGSPHEVNVGPRLAAPSADWLAGTDSLGRSVLPRLAQGLRTTFLLAGAAILLTAAISVILGMVAAYYSGVVGELITRTADVFFAFPVILLGLLVVTISGPGATGAVISIALICSPMMVRVVRAASLSVVNRDFITAARVGGARPARILFIHVLPNIAGPAIVQGTYVLSVGMLLESALSFLGLGIQPPDASLGSLVHEGAIYLSLAPWLALIPGVLLVLVIMSVNLLGDGLRDKFDVRAVEVRR